jgi:CBS domain-containing protein
MTDVHHILRRGRRNGLFNADPDVARAEDVCRWHGFRVEHVMIRDPYTVRGDATLDEAVVDTFTRYLFTAFPVVDASGIAIGLISFQEVRAVPWADRSTVTVAQAMAQGPGLIVALGTPVGEVVEAPAFAQHGRAVVVGPTGAPIGLVSISDLHRTEQSTGAVSAHHLPWQD